MSSRENSASAPPAATVFRPDRGNIIAAVLIAAIALIVIGWAPTKLFWLLAFPIAMIYWCLRARTTVSDTGIDITYAFRGGRSLLWSEVNGVAFVRSTAKVRTTDDDTYTLPGVTFTSIPRLAEASHGRIPDVTTAALEAADGKMEVIDRNGHKVLLTQEQYQQHLAETQQTEQPHHDN